MQNEPTDDTLFEQKLAAHRPRLLREITLHTTDSHHAMPTIAETLTNLVQSWQAFDRKIRPQIKVGLCCFLLGAVTMFVLMTCCFDRVPTDSRTMLASNATVSKPPRIRMMPLGPQDLDGVRSPADLMTRIRQQPDVVVKPEVQGTVLRAFSGYFHHEEHEGHEG